MITFGCKSLEAEPPKMGWPSIQGYFRFTDPMEERERCDQHPTKTYWECWMQHFNDHKIPTQAVTFESAGGNWIAVYRGVFYPDWRK